MKTLLLRLSCIALMSPTFLSAQKADKRLPWNHPDIPFAEARLLPVRTDIPITSVENPAAHRGRNTLTASAKKKSNTLMDLHLVKDLDTVGEINGSWAAPVGVISKDEVLVKAYTPETGWELYTSDGTGNGTTLLHDINPGAASSDPRQFVNKDKAHYFFAAGVGGKAVYRTNGKANGLKRVSAYFGSSYFMQNMNVADNGNIFFIMYNHELWSSDGSETGGVKLISGIDVDSYITIVHNTAFFVAGDAEHGYELWKSDGTVAGTTMVKDINPGPGNSQIYSLFAYGNNVFFGASDGIAWGFWKSDGTSAGTTKVSSTIAPTFYDYENQAWYTVYCESNHLLYFTGINVTTMKVALWKTDGTESGTVMVKVIDPRFNSGYAENLRDIDGVLFFTAFDGIHRQSLWKSEGEEENTVFVHELTAGGSDEDYFNYYSTVLKGKLYFVNYETGTIWVSDGTTANTNEVSNEALNGAYWYTDLLATDNKLFFSAFTNELGKELYVGDLVKDKSKKLQEGVPVSKETDLLATVYPNPSRSNPVLQLGGNVKNITISVSDMSGKVVWQKTYSDQQTIQLPLSKMNAGVYIVTVKNNKETKTLRFVKQ